MYADVLGSAAPGEKLTLAGHYIMSGGQEHSIGDPWTDTLALPR